jgi:defect-in-organelle-trafficking protein DotC
MAADLPPLTLDEAQRLFDRPALAQPSGDASRVRDLSSLRVDQAANEAQKARAQALVDTALSLGIKAGLAWQLKNIDRVVVSSARELDSIYDFSALMFRDRVVPPVITEARNLYNQDGDYAVRLSGALYKIERQARFSSVPPNWREYLSFPAAPLDRTALASMFGPASDQELVVWKRAVSDGWRQGVEQANLMLGQAFDRLNRDFSGMSRFHRFVLEGKVSVPAIAAEDVAITQTGASMSVDETLLRITTLPAFNGKLLSWQGVVISEPAPLPGPIRVQPTVRP